MKYEYWFIEYEGGGTDTHWFRDGDQVTFLGGELDEDGNYLGIRVEPAFGMRLLADQYLSAVKLREVEQ